MSTIKDLLKASLEECTSCNQSAVNGGSNANGNVVKTIKPTLVITGRAGQRSTDKGDDAFTYNDGTKDKKQLVQLTGPLGQAYVDALNIVFDKKPVLNSEDVPDDLDGHDLENVLSAARIAQDQQQAAQESYLTNGDRVHEAIAEIISAPAMKIVDEKASIRIVDEASIAAHAQNAAETTPNIIGYVTNVADVVTPSAVSYIENAATLAETHLVVVITDQKRGTSQGMGLRERFVDLSALKVKNYNPIFDKADTDIAMEALYGHLDNVSFVRSFEEFMQVVDEALLQPQETTNEPDAMDDTPHEGSDAGPDASGDLPVQPPESTDDPVGGEEPLPPTDGGEEALSGEAGPGTPESLGVPGGPAADAEQADEPLPSAESLMDNMTMFFAGKLKGL